MDRILKFEFDELPLIISNGYEAGLVAGSAEISYDRDGLWSVASIALDGSKAIHYTLEERVAHEFAQGRIHPNLRRPLPPYDRKLVHLDAGTPLYSMIIDTLERPWASNVQDAIRDDMHERHADIPSIAADLRRDERERVM